MPSSDSYVSIRRHAIAPWQFKHRMLPWRDNTFALARPRLQSMMDSARHIWLHEVDHTHTGCNESADRQPNRLMSESSHAMCSYLGSKKGHHIHEKLQSCTSPKVQNASGMHLFQQAHVYCTGYKWMSPWVEHLFLALYRPPLPFILPGRGWLICCTVKSATPK
jgi:hypothetical protein